MKKIVACILLVCLFVGTVSSFAEGSIDVFEAENMSVWTQYSSGLEEGGYIDQNGLPVYPIIGLILCDFVQNNAEDMDVLDAIIDRDNYVYYDKENDEKKIYIYLQRQDGYYKCCWNYDLPNVLMCGYTDVSEEQFDKAIKEGLAYKIDYPTFYNSLFDNVEPWSALKRIFDDYKSFIGMYDDFDNNGL